MLAISDAPTSEVSDHVNREKKTVKIAPTLMRPYNECGPLFLKPRPVRYLTV